eukprot:TRINITY_DN10651_c0_g2_i1.p1 TRINITY_DN10651_c0_g2~~TRINITY_DN10651_c0_g2_i1.p1  ORF type:complete len:768 (-),score=162.75 TRINITY_DN10651_c0_g2_i1:149-2452(-)
MNNNTELFETNEGNHHVYLQKTLPEGFFLALIWFNETCICCELYAMASPALVLPGFGVHFTSNLRDKTVEEAMQVITREAVSLKDKIHINSFVFDFQIKQLVSFLFSSTAQTPEKTQSKHGNEIQQSVQHQQSENEFLHNFPSKYFMGTLFYLDQPLGDGDTIKSSRYANNRIYSMRLKLCLELPMGLITDNDNDFSKDPEFGVGGKIWKFIVNMKKNNFGCQSLVSHGLYPVLWFPSVVSDEGGSVIQMDNHDSEKTDRQREGERICTIVVPIPIMSLNSNFVTEPQLPSVRGPDTTTIPKSLPITVGPSPHAVTSSFPQTHGPSGLSNLTTNPPTSTIIVSNPTNVPAMPRVTDEVPAGQNPLIMYLQVYILHTNVFGSASLTQLCRTEQQEKDHLVWEKKPQLQHRSAAGNGIASGGNTTIDVSGDGDGDGGGWGSRKGRTNEHKIKQKAEQMVRKVVEEGITQFSRDTLYNSFVSCASSAGKGGEPDTPPCICTVTHTSEDLADSLALPSPQPDQPQFDLSNSCFIPPICYREFRHLFSLIHQRPLYEIQPVLSHISFLGKVKWQELCLFLQTIYSPKFRKFSTYVSTHHLILLNPLDRDLFIHLFTAKNMDVPSDVHGIVYTSPTKGIPPDYQPIPGERGWESMLLPSVDEVANSNPGREKNQMDEHSPRSIEGNRRSNFDNQNRVPTNNSDNKKQVQGRPSKSNPEKKGTVSDCICIHACRRYFDEANMEQRNREARHVGSVTNSILHFIWREIFSSSQPN